ncbi:MAG: hypothetical protein R6V50_08430 [Thermoplasmatota archaeon]
MGKKNYAVIIIISLIMILSSFVLISSAEENVLVKINIVGEQIQTLFDRPVVVAGIWHHFDITFENSDYSLVEIKFYKGMEIPSTLQRNESNYYEFSYDDNTKIWTDLEEYDGYRYINEEQCQKNGNSVLFCIGIKDTFPDDTYYYENWTLEIYKDSTNIYSDTIIVEKPKPGFSRSHYDTINFNITPFSKENIYNENEYFTVTNVGNIPLTIYIDYGAYNNSIQSPFTNVNLSPKDTTRYYLTLLGEAWRPGILTFQGSIVGTVPSELIITTSEFTLSPSIEMNAANIKIYVGHSDYLIRELPGSHIVFQYQDKIEMNEGEIKDVVVYVSGEGYVKLDIQADEENVEILKITSIDQTGSPLLINSINTSEYEVTVRIHALKENRLGIITYTLEEDGKVSTYSTEISIGPPTSEKKEESNIPISTIFVVFCIVIVIIYMILAQIKHKRR